MLTQFSARYLILFFFSFAISLNGWGQAASVTWALTSDNTAGTPTGNITANTATLTNGCGSIGNNSYGTYSQGWPSASSPTVNTSGIYFQFSLSPTAGNNLSISSISFSNSISSGTGKYVVYYSYSSSFTSPTIIGSATSIPTAFSQNPGLTVNSGQTIYIGVFAYNFSNSGCNGSTFRIKNFVVSGTTTSSCTLPGTPSCSTPGAVCAGNAATITGAGSSNATSYTYWTTSGGNTAVTTSTTPPGTVASSNLTTPTSLAANTYTYYVQGENACGSSASRQSVTVTVKANTTPAVAITTPAGSTLPVCSGGSGSFVATASNLNGTTPTYSWLVNGSAAPGGTNSTSYTYNSPANGAVVSCNISTTAGCVTSTSASSSGVTVSVVSTPSTPTGFSGSLSVCAGSSQTYSVTNDPTATSYTWSTTGTGWSGFGTLLTNSASVTAGTAGGTISVKAVNGCGTSSAYTTTATVTVTSIPSTPTITAVETSGATPNDGKICNGNSVQLTTTATGVTYSWSSSGGTGATSSSYSPGTNTTYTLTVAATANSACSVSNTYTVTVTTPPTAVTVSGGGAVCGTSVTLSATGGTGTGSTMYWENTTGGNTDKSTPETSQSVSATGTYYFNAYTTSGAGCWGTQGSATVSSLTAPPSAPATPTAAANPSCGATTLNIITPATGTTDYWGGTSSTNSFSTTYPTSATYPVPSTGTYYVWAKDNTSGCWSSSNSVSVTVNTAPSISASPSNRSIAAGANTTFTVTASNAASYLWEVSTDGGGTWSTVTSVSPYSGATSATLTITGATIGMNSYQYRATANGNTPCSSAGPSSVATLTVSICTPASGQSCTSDYITSFATTGGTTNITNSTMTSCNNGNGNYYNYGTSKGTLTVIPSTSTSFTINLNTYNNPEGIAIWIDWNGDGVFQSSECVVYGVTTTATSPYSYSTTITVPAISTIGTTINYGTTVMRVLAASGSRYDATTTSADDCYQSYSGNYTYGEYQDYTVVVQAPCTSPNTLAFVAAPANVVQNATMSTVTVKAYCSSNSMTATGYTGAVTLTVSGGGCGYASQTVNAVAGIATFSSIVFDRSTQTGITMTATASGLTSTTSGTFNVTTPSGTASNTTIVNENFDGNTPHWAYTSTVTHDNTTYGTPVIGIRDYTSNTHYGSQYATYDKALVKSQSANNDEKDGESTGQIVFTNLTGLGSYNSVQVSFSVGSLPSFYTGATGNGVDENENLVIETSLDGGSTWSKVLTYYGYSNYLLPLSTSSPVTLAYNANASYNSNHANTSTQSAFVINLPSGTSQFNMRMTATDNREEENWAIDNIQVIGTTTASGVPEPLPTATGATYSTCSSTGQDIGVALANTQGAVTYLWSPTSNISSTTAAGPSVTVSTATNYSVTATDADGCTASATDAVNTTTPSGNVALAAATVSAIEPSCPDGSGWTYYTDPADATKWYFGIYKNGNNFMANVDLTLETTTPTYELKSNSGRKEALYTMGRYWNVVVASGSINGSTNPVKVRFFYNTADVTKMQTDALTLAQGWGLGASSISAPEWFKTKTGTYYDPGNNTYSDVPNKLSPSSFTTTTGTINSLTYVEYDGLQGFSGGSIGVRISPAGYALPVELLYLTAEPIDNSYVKLNWATASEIDNAGFDIERSDDGVNFSKIGFVAGHGTSTVQNDYALNDMDVYPNAVYYYRTRQLDVNGNYEYSSIVSVMLLSQQGFVMDELRPNPASDQVVVNVIAADIQTAGVSVYDMLGRLVLTQAWELSPGLNGTKLDISTVSAGNYNVCVRSVNGIFSKRLTIIR